MQILTMSDCCQERYVQCQYWWCHGYFAICVVQGYLESILDAFQPMFESKSEGCIGMAIFGTFTFYIVLARSILISSKRRVYIWIYNLEVYDPFHVV